jgi:hypothetical protein
VVIAPFYFTEGLFPETMLAYRAKPIHGGLVTSESSSLEHHEMELAVSDQGEFLALRDWLRGQPGVEVKVTAGTPGPGELGALEVLTVLAGSSGLVTAIKTLPEFIRSRREGLRIETTFKGEKFILEATNVQDVLAIMERLRGD